jgi:hypothetical protein
MAFTKWFEITKPPTASRIIEQPRMYLPDRIRVFPMAFHCQYGPRHPFPKPDHIRSFDARIKSGHDKLMPAARPARVVQEPSPSKAEGAGKAGCQAHPQPCV